MYISKKVYLLIGAALAGIVLALIYALLILVPDSEVSPDGKYIRRIQEVRESMLLQSHITKLISYAREIASGTQRPYNEQIAALAQARKKLQSLSEEAPKYDLNALPADDNPEWAAFLRVKKQCSDYNQDLFQHLDAILANPSPQAVEEFQQYMAKEHDQHAGLVIELNKSVLALTDISTLSNHSVKHILQDSVNYVVMIVLFIALLLSLMFVILFFLIKTLFKNRIKRFVASLKWYRGERPTRRIAVPPAERWEKLHILFKSIQAQMRSVAHSMEILSKGIQQVATDRANLSALSSAIEASRSKFDGFSVVSGELLALDARTNRFSDDVYKVALSLRAVLAEVMEELEQARQYIEPRHTDIPATADTPAVADTAGAIGLSDAVSKVSASLEDRSRQGDWIQPPA